MPRWMQGYSDAFLLSTLKTQKDNMKNDRFSKEYRDNCARFVIGLESEILERYIIIDNDTAPMMDIASLIWQNRDP